MEVKLLMARCDVGQNIPQSRETPPPFRADYDLETLMALTRRAVSKEMAGNGYYE